MDFAKSEAAEEQKFLVAELARYKKVTKDNYPAGCGSELFHVSTKPEDIGFIYLSPLLISKPIVIVHHSINTAFVLDCIC
jgi:hypothetical protein